MSLRSVNIYRVIWYIKINERDTEFHILGLGVSRESEKPSHRTYEPAEYVAAS